MTDVVVVGEALIDIVERPDGTRAEHVGGSPANIAFGVARLGRSVLLHSAVGRDARGDAIASHLGGAGVALTPQSRSADATSTALARIREDGSADYDFDIRWDPAAVELPAAAVLHIGSIGLFLEPGWAVVMDAVESAANLVTLDPNIRPALVGAHAVALERFERAAASSDVVKLSDEDAAWLYPALTGAEALVHIRALGPSLTFLTRGAEAALVCGAHGIDEIAVTATTVVDTIGAGDSFMASIIDSLVAAASADLDAAQLAALGRQASAAAAITVSRAGAMPPTHAELDARL